jgi:hypothetical protein
VKVEKPAKRVRSEAEKEILRQAKRNPLVFFGTIVVLVIVILAFVLVPAIVPSAVGANDAAFTFGKWGKTPIKYTPQGYFANTREYYARYAQVYGYSEFQVWRQAFESTTVHIAALDFMQKAGYEPPKAVVDKRVSELSQFQDNGRFSLAKYNSLSNTQKLALWKDVHDGMITERFVSDSTSLKISQKEADFVGSMTKNMRKFSVAVFPLSDYPESELISYENEHSDLFRSLHLSQITISSSEKDAQTILDDVKSGASTFEDAAKAHSADSFAEKGGDAGARLAYELQSLIPDEEQRNAVLTLPVSALSSIVKVPAGWAFFRAEEAPKSLDTTNSENLAKVRTYLLANERGRLEDFILAQAEVFAADSAERGFDTILEQRGIDKKEFGPVPVNYGDSTLFSTLSSFGISELGGAATSENFWKTAFTTEFGKPSAPIVLGDNIIVLCPVKEDAAPVAVEGGDDSTTTASASSESSPEKNTSDTFKSWWANNESQSALQNSIMSNPKLEDNFFQTYFTLFQG